MEPSKNAPAIKPKIHVALQGPEVCPEETAAGELGMFIKYLETIIVETAREQKLDLGADQALVSLVNIQPGSNRLTLAVFATLTVAASLVTRSIEEGAYSALPIRVHKELFNVFEQAKKNNWTVSFEADKDLHIAPAMISADFPVPDPTSRRISGKTTLFGCCTRVGGVRPRAELRLKGTNRIVYLDVTESIAKKLGRCLYEDVAIEGDAIWEPETWEIKEFKAIELKEYRNTDPVLAFEELGRLADGVWDNIDVNDFVGEMRASGVVDDLS